jgi:hypothetical protein
VNNSYLPLLSGLSRIEPHPLIMGGFAEDALLHGKTTRHHEDVDLLISRADLDYYLPFFAELGFSHYELFLSDPSGRPTVLNSLVDGVALELCIADRAPDSRLCFDVFGDPDHTPYRIFLPEDLAHPETASIDGVPIHTVTPLALYQLRAALGQTNSFGGFRPKDLIAQKALKERFFAGKTEADLAPHIETLAPRGG